MALAILFNQQLAPPKWIGEAALLGVGMIDQFFRGGHPPDKDAKHFGVFARHLRECFATRERISLGEKASGVRTRICFTCSKIELS